MGVRGYAPPPPCTPRKILKVETNLICAIWGILEANLRKSSTLKFMTNNSFVPSICIHRSIILIFIQKTSILVDFFPRKILFLPFLIFISMRILISATNSRLWYGKRKKKVLRANPVKPCAWHKSTRVPIFVSLVWLDCRPLSPALNKMKGQIRTTWFVICDHVAFQRKQIESRAYEQIPLHKTWVQRLCKH